jgi:hypothetical protein
MYKVYSLKNQGMHNVCVQTTQESILEITQ